VIRVYDATGNVIENQTAICGRSAGVASRTSRRAISRRGEQACDDAAFSGKLRPINHEKTYLAVAAFDNPGGDACDRGNEVTDPRSHN